MKRKIKVTGATQPNKRVKKVANQESDTADFYARWYAKFGKPETRTMPADEFLQMLKEVIEFE